MNIETRTVPQPIRVLLAHSQILMRRALQHLIEARTTFRIVAEATNVDGILEHTRQGRIDVIALDSGLPGLDETEALPWRGGRHAPGTVIIARHHGVTDLHRALHIGANGYVTKDDDPGILYLALQAAAAERSFLSPRVTRVVLESLVTSKPRHSADAGTARDGGDSTRATGEAHDY